MLCADRGLLDAIVVHSSSLPLFNADRIRGIELVSDAQSSQWLGANGQPERLFAKPDFPEVIWGAALPRYVGVEYYLDGQEAGTEQDWLKAHALIEAIRTSVVAAQ